MVKMSKADFENTVREAIDGIGEELLAAIENVVILVEDEPDPDDLAGSGHGHDGGELLGIYVGIPLTQREGGLPGLGPPDRIVLFRGPLSRTSATRAELVRQIGVTVRHEVGHYFGISEARLHELGWG